MMTPEEYLNELLTLPIIYDELLPQVSRNLKWVAWTWFNKGPASDVFVSRLDGSTPPIRLTDTPDNTLLVSWTPDSQSVIVAQDKDGNERDQLFRINLAEPFVMVPLTEADPNYFIRGGQLHPNGHWLVFGANYDFTSGEEIEATWLYRQDISTAERLLLSKPIQPCYVTPKLNWHGTHILYNRKDEHPAGNQIWLVDIQGQEDREILNFGSNVKTFASWHPDGNHILVLVETPTHRRLGLTDMEAVEIRWLLDDPALDIETAYIPNNTNTAVVIINQQGRLSSMMIDLESESILSIPDIHGNLLPIAPYQSISSHTAPNEKYSEKTWLGLFFNGRQPEEIIHFNLEDVNTDSFQPISRVWDNTNLAMTDLHPAETFTWESTDGLLIHGWLYRTTRKAKGTIIYVHGGPSWHSRDALNAQIQFYLHSGFNVLDPNYRGSTGYGLPFREAIKEDGWGGREQDDIRTGIETLIQKGIAKQGKVGITGTSYGGYSAWWAITHFPREIVSAAAPICGMTDLVIDYETTRPDLRPFSEEMMGGSPTQVPDRFHQRSPINFIENISGHLMIVQGAQDPNVTPKNVSDVESALKKNRIPYETLIFEDEGHGISKRENKRILYLRLVDFFEHALNS